MTEDERKEEGSEDLVEDLEAPASAQEDVAGGKMGCIPPSCIAPASDVINLCNVPTCKATKAGCDADTHTIIVREA